MGRSRAVSLPEWLELGSSKFELKHVSIADRVELEIELNQNTGSANLFDEFRS